MVIKCVGKEYGWYFFWCLNMVVKFFCFFIEELGCVDEDCKVGLVIGFIGFVNWFVGVFFKDCC